jgi:hypothetical protein
MFRFLALCLIGAAALPATAADVLLNTTGAKPGKYVLTVNADGSVSVGPFSQTLDLSLTPPTPGPGPTPVLTERGKAVMAAAAKVTGDTDRAGTAQGLAEMYRQLADAAAVMSPAPTPESLFIALSAANNKFLADVPPDHRNVQAQWQPVRSVIGTYWTALQGQPTASFVALLRESAAGLDASAPSPPKSLNPDMLKLILQIIQLIMQLLQSGPPAGR